MHSTGISLVYMYIGCSSFCGNQRGTLFQQDVYGPSLGHVYFLGKHIQMLHSNPTAPLPTLAFSEDRATVLNGELSKGFIIPKKEKEVSFFRCKNDSGTISREGAKSSQSGPGPTSPSVVKILVGTKERMQEWLRKSGAGSSCLWAQVEDFPQGSRRKILSQQLQLTYRLHSDQNMCIPILNGTLLELSPVTAHGEGLKKDGLVKSFIKESKWPSLVVESKIQNPSSVSSSSVATGDMNSSIEREGLSKTEKFVGLVMPENAYKELVVKVSPSGLIREYQELLRRLVKSPNFLDVDFRHLDLHNWMTCHQYAAFIEKHDVLVVVKRDGVSSLRWALLRFEFVEGLVRSTMGEDLSDVECNFRDKDMDQVFRTPVSWWTRTIIPKVHQNILDKRVNKREWMAWRFPIKNEDLRVGPLTCILSDVLGLDGMVPVAELESLKSLFGSQQVGELISHSTASVWEIETVLAIRRNKEMSTKQQSALSYLRNDSKELKGRGLGVLLNLLLAITPRETSPSRSSGHTNDSQAKIEVETVKIMDWLKSGFLEALLEKTMVGPDDGEMKNAELEGVDYKNVEVVADACLRVLQIVPREGSARLVRLLIISLKDICEKFLKLNVAAKEKGDVELRIRPRDYNRLKGLGIAETNPGTQKIDFRETLEKVHKFCTLLSLLISKSPLVGGPFAESGGLDLVLNLYFLLMKRFPGNLRLGALSGVMGVSKNLGRSLPGEVIRSHDTTLKVLPCILPSYCICKITEACLMDHCMSRRELGQVDFTGSSSVKWKTLSPLTQFFAGSHTGSAEMVHKDGPCEDCLGWNHDINLMPELSKDLELSSLQDTNHTLIMPKLMYGGHNFTDSPSLLQNKSSSSSVPIGNLRQIGCSGRPFVPRLPLNSLKRFTSNLESSVDSRESQADTVVAMSDLSQVQSMCDLSTPEFQIFTVVCNVKLELLQTMGSLLSGHSRSLCVMRNNLRKKLQAGKGDQLVLRFLPDIIGGLLEIVPKSTSTRLQRMLFQVISLLDGGKTSDAKSSTRSSSHEEILIGTDGSGTCPSFPSEHKKCIEILLVEVGERLTVLVCHLSQMLTMSSNHLIEADNSTQMDMGNGTLDYSDPLSDDRTISNGHILSLWVDIGLLIRVLTDFVLVWPEEGLVKCILNFCGRQVESVLGLLADYSDKNSWSLAPILTMQYLLKFFAVCMNSIVLETSQEYRRWGEVDTFFWQLLVMNDFHWNCIKTFTTVVMKSCEGCLKDLLEGYQRILWEPVEIYYNLLGQRFSHKWLTDNLASTVHGVDITKCIFSFLKVSILIMKKRLNCQREITQPRQTFSMGRLIFLLDFLMNPVEGLLMSVIKTPTRHPSPSIKLDKLEREIEALNSSNCLKKPESSTAMYQLGSELTVPINSDVFKSHVQIHCRKCTTTNVFAKKITSSMKHESLFILADIFALKSSELDDKQSSLCLNPRAQNPFLFQTYVTPFLDIIFFYFLKFYKKKADYSGPRPMSAVSQRISERSRRLRDTKQQRTSDTTVDNIFSVVVVNDQDVVSASVNMQDDEAASVACLTYGHALRALAQNQTKDVSQSFLRARLMNFLVQQISLEYKVSQMATPRDIEQDAGLATDPITQQQFQVFGEFESRVSKPEFDWSGCLPKRSYIQSKVESMNSSKVEDDRGRDKKVDITSKSLCGAIPTVVSKTPALVSTKVSPVSRRIHDLQSSLEQKRFSALELAFGCFRQNVQHPSGFLSARSMSTGFRNDGNIPKQPSPSFQNFMLNLQEEVSTSSRSGSEAMVSLNEQGCTTMIQQSMSEHETSSTQAFSTKSNEFFIPNAQNGDVQDMEVQGRDLTTASKLHNFVPATSASCPQQPLQDREKGHEMVGRGLNYPMLRYTGRFFDLNEEVERELAEEDSADSHGSISQETKLTRPTKDLQMMDTIQPGHDLFKLHLPNISSRNGCCNQASASEPSSAFKSLESSTKLKTNRPAIPRLNLSKSTRKGGPTINSDTLVDLQLLSSIFSTSEAKGKLSSLLEIQEELQKEVASATGDNMKRSSIANYETERFQRRIYRHAGLHVLLLELFMALMLTPQLIISSLRGTLEACYSDRYPMENRKLNAPFFLSYHLNHAANVHLLPCLSKKIKDFKPAAFRILKLSCRALFNTEIYTNRVRIARGAVSQVYTARMKGHPSKAKDVEEDRVVLKIVDVPKGPYDPCKFIDVYSEVEILEKFLGVSGVCQILDYGVDTESFILVLKHYKCSLHTWRQGHYGKSNSDGSSRIEIQRDLDELSTNPFLDRLPLYLEVYYAVLRAVKILEIENVVHYDLKCDNILLEPLDPSCSESEFWTPIWPPIDPSKPLPFRICIADFGQSKASTYLGGECTVRNRGTEYVKSPEMLKLLSNQSQRDSDFNLKNTDAGVGKAVDVWSLGCLLYELLTGEYLFYDEDWLQFFMRVTLPSEELITKEKVAKLDNYEPVVDLLRFILVRDPLQRPSLDEVAICVEQLQLKVEETTSNYTKKVLTRIVTLFEEDFGTNRSFSNQEIFSRSIEGGVVEGRYEHYVKAPSKPKDSLRCLKTLCCHCQCDGGV